MSLTEKLGSLLARGGGAAGALPERDDAPWLMRYSARGLGTVGSFVAILLGLYNCIGILLGDVYCLLGGLWMMMAGFLVIVCEAPCCCFFVDFVQPISDKIEGRPYWNKAIGYIGIAIPAFIFCFDLATILGAGSILGTGIIYGMMALGKKGSVDDMRSAATMEAGLSQPPSNLRSNLVANAQPISFTGSPIKNETY